MTERTREDLLRCESIANALVSTHPRLSLSQARAIADSLPLVALSIRHAWAYAVAMGWKPIENRTWPTGMPARRFRGDFCIHASTSMSKREYEDSAAFIRERGFDVPAPADLQRGGIIGVARVVDVVTKTEDPWFFKQKRNIGLVIEAARSIPFIPVRGALGFFEWKPDMSFKTEPAKWMLPAVSKPSQERLVI